jgi:long-chain acyl-CoA synthetase
MPTELDNALEHIIGELTKEGQPFETAPYEKNGVAIPAFKNAPLSERLGVLQAVSPTA